MRHALLIGAFLCAGCARDSQPIAILPDTTTVDGVLVMHHDATAFDRAPQWTLDRVPTVIVDGDADPEYHLLGAEFAGVLTDGGVAIIQGGYVLVFDSIGRPRRRLDGRGPTTRPLALLGGMTFLAADTLLSADYRRPLPDFPPEFHSAFPTEIRLASLRDGGVRAVPMAADSPPCAQVLGVLDTGLLVVSSSSCSDGPSLQDGRLVLAVGRADRDLGRYTSLFQVLGASIVPDSGPRRWTRVGFSPEAHLMVWDGWIVSADGSAYQIERRDAAGVVRSRIVVDRPRVAVTDDMRAAARSLAPGVPPVVFADSLPVLRSLQVDAEGLLWVSDYHLGSDSTWSATAFREDGAIVGRIGGSGNVRRPESFSRGWVWTRESDGPNTPWFGRWRVVARSVE